ncbi:hypothetical protein G6M89_17340 [Natronolimnobius sp. AArcel1]|uniref:hypothetical protein n=1 Tax=Natronolimnobius sp. AArcel1 TaxID=1679093 RepID=UPI0013EBBFE7|nr:hypothetical protein [Natronolimnobius sp. AArcel1]NGM70749.1 hypothetical protein [Natronolimnobius sp. AArcel1]
MTTDSGHSESLYSSDPVVTSVVSGTTQQADDDNETVRHQNPETYSEDADDEELEEWLSGWLSEQLEESAAEISDGQYDAASEYLGDEFDERLEQYVSVSGETDDDEPSAYEQAQQDQQNLSATISEYNETQEEYQEARDDGDDDRARELARELESLAGDISDTSQTVRNHYDAIGEATDADVDSSTEAINSTNQSVQTDQDQIRDSEFEQTTIEITSTESETVSFTDPLVATGEVTTDDGTPVANETIQLNVGNQLLEVDTDQTGSFEFTYRPISIAAGTTDIDIQYIPDDESTHLDSETTITADVDQVEPTISITSVEPETVAYNEAVSLEVELQADGHEIDDVPLAVSIAETDLGTGSLESGSLYLDGEPTLPAGVSAGEQPLRVSLPFEDSALEPVTAETTVTVEETDPDLTIDVTDSDADENELTVNGSLTAVGDGLGGESVAFALDGTTLETVTTAEDGSFGSTLSIPADTPSDAELTATYTDADTNIGDASETTTLSLAGDSTGIPWLWIAVAMGVFAVVGAGGGLYWYRSRGSPGTSSDSSNDSIPPGNHATSETVAVSEPSAPSLTEVLFEEATGRLTNGEADAAVRTCYTAVRHTLEPQLRSANTASYTHWEFYRAFQQQTATTSMADSLRTITEGYEMATFDTAGISQTEAETILENAQQLCADDDTDSR